MKLPWFKKHKECNRADARICYIVAWRRAANVLHCNITSCCKRYFVSERSCRL